MNRTIKRKMSSRVFWELRQQTELKFKGMFSNWIRKIIRVGNSFLINLVTFSRPRPTVTIFAEEYARFLKQEIQMIKYKEACQEKAAEIKKLQDQLGYFKKQVLILRNNQKEVEPPSKKQSDFATVIKLK